jgi:hypothetical protein
MKGLTMQISFRLTATDKNKFEVDTAMGDLDQPRIGSPWSHFGDFATIEEAAAAAGEEVAYQYKQGTDD